jgi:hypothetical protein
MLLDVGAVTGRARYCRERCGFVGRPPPYSTRKVIETCFKGLTVTGAALPTGLIEMAERHSSGRRALFYKRGIPNATQRVGIAHGLHHFLSDLRREPGTSECNTNLRWLENAAKLTQDPIEVACDLFAGELLVPFDVLDEMAPEVLFPKDKTAKHLFDDEVDHLASRFNVPVGFVRWRLFDLAQLRRSHFFIR